MMSKTFKCGKLIFVKKQENLVSLIKLQSWFFMSLQKVTYFQSSKSRSGSI